VSYFYYPGCSLEGTGREYDFSTRAIMKVLGVDLLELDDWTCCGASAAEAVSKLLSLVLPARNLALAERTGNDADFLVPCSACYLNHKRVEEQVKQDSDLRDHINEALAGEGLSFGGGTKVRHLLDVMANDIGAKAIEDRVKTPLSGLKVAPYYGCQGLRPYPCFDDPEKPRSMEPLIKAAGADVHPFEMAAKCCGGALMTTKPEAGIVLVEALLKAAEGADCIVTVCPLCQMNLESYQNRASKLARRDLQISILYLPQLIGLALGLSRKEVKINHNMAVTSQFEAKVA